jgi:hypothetical protein
MKEANAQVLVMGLCSCRRISPSSTRERAQRFLKDPEIHVTAKPHLYEVALEVFSGWDVS